ncbi:hypothetical protein FHS15_003790 [Paenibacillus castaneae]|uniref:DUF6483 family protein n=1 Tax=Paenibacillus castaneae TaxID=474957 RepID=UPI000C9B0B26|nr:DUF6483 family protein [Paenibacillus castaneae]NIK78644.1 hypothetical protein [Paenibacillus castaneae]
MFQRDYFMRMIEQMTEAVGQIMNLKRERKQEEALFVIDDWLNKRFRLSSKLIRSLSDEDLLKVMTTNGIVETDNMGAIAVLMKQEAELCGELDREDESFAAYIKALHLFIRLSLIGAEPTIIEPRGQIEELLVQLEPYELPISTKRLLMEWYEAEAKFNLAEDMMHELLDDQMLQAADAATIYKRMLLHSDEDLEAGGLPRDEVVQGLQALLGA